MDSWRSEPCVDGSKRTFEPQTGLFLGVLALLVLAGLLLAAPAWWPRPSLPRNSFPDRLLPGIQSTSVIVRTVGCLLLGYGLGQSLGSRAATGRERIRQVETSTGLFGGVQLKRYIGAYGVLVRGGNVLLIHKARGPYTGTLDLPGDWNMAKRLSRPSSGSWPRKQARQ